ncbi:sulfotransferase family protein [Amycolatopsis sp. NPDC049252]|uniref:sulfotransferase family protein n=1 Tax=Amycolatopsis sp. NPDC049252 TaxID=3363933 RepID=UPI003724792F
MVEVIGAGFGRTGTMSVRAALEALGRGPCHHMADVLGEPAATVRWTAALRGDREALRAAVAGYRATSDFPGCLLWRELMDLFPDAKVLLSVRDPESWYRSAVRTIFDPVMDQVFAKLGPETVEFVAALAERGYRRHPGRDAAVAWFTRHNAEVRAAVPAEKLLVYEVREGWEPLCGFLGADVPPEPFPRVNDSGDFTGTVARFLGGG